MLPHANRFKDDFMDDFRSGLRRASRAFCAFSQTRLAARRQETIEFGSRGVATGGGFREIRGVRSGIFPTRGEREPVSRRGGPAAPARERNRTGSASIAPNGAGTPSLFGSAFGLNRRMNLAEQHSLGLEIEAAIRLLRTRDPHVTLALAQVTTALEAVRERFPQRDAAPASPPARAAALVVARDAVGAALDAARATGAAADTAAPLLLALASLHNRLLAASEAAAKIESCP